MAFSASDVKALREKTGAGMMACKEALKETNGDLEGAIDYLRKKGLAAVAKKQGRTAAEGVVVNVVNGQKGVILEVNCETDFVSKGDDFQGFAKTLAQYALDNGVADVEKLRAEKAEAINELTLKCGEKVDVRRMLVVEGKGQLGFYNHGGKIGVVVDAEAANDELLKDLAMHVAAAAPSFLTSSDIDESFKKREADIYAAQLKEEGKPENMIPKIVEGKLRKLASEVCLLEQKFVKNPDLSVSKHVKEVAGDSAKVLGFYRLVLGEGVEKKEDNLAEEVAKMTGKQ
jgi:elongation factor Ts